MRTQGARGLALFAGAFTAFNLLRQVTGSSLDGNVWCVDLRPLGPGPRGAALLLAAIAFLAFALRPRAGRARGAVTTALAALGAAVAVANAVTYYRLLAAGAIGSWFPVPLSLLTALVLAWIASAAWHSSDGRDAAEVVRFSARRTRAFVVSGTCAACCLAFPLLQMLCFGSTDYRRPADAAVVFGAAVYRNGTLSNALSDRVRTGVELYRTGLVERLVFSGGPGPGAVHETTAMRDFARRLGVPERDIILDPAGVSTAATVTNTTELFARSGVRRALAVSHFYHLPRIKLEYQRHGVEVFTVPAREERILHRLPYFLAREVVALWVYFLR